MKNNKEQITVEQYEVFNGLILKKKKYLLKYSNRDMFSVVEYVKKEKQRKSKDLNPIERN